MKKVHLLRREKIKIKKVVLLTLISNGTIRLRRKITYRKHKEIINLLVEETLKSLHKFVVFRIF